MWDPENGYELVDCPADDAYPRPRGLFSRARALVRAWWRRPAGPRIAIGLGDRRRARQLRLAIARALSERSRAIGLVPPPELTILVDRSVFVGETRVTSCLDVIVPQDLSMKRYLIRIALADADGPREIDEVIADLDHQLQIGRAHV